MPLFRLKIRMVYSRYGVKMTNYGRNNSLKVGDNKTPNNMGSNYNER